MIVCPADAVDDVLAAAGPDRSVDVLPFAPGAVDERSAIAAVIERETADLLGMEGIDARADLFDIGLDSLKLIQFTSALERHGKEILTAPERLGTKTSTSRTSSRVR
ncbi:phosphopantetheine-binding protein [Nocardiopsis synnemataformans]|uniref:acyl carrier protein n=1 Tax=Nocardiopsis synnemataformans TaxID=61305 RepID=UPI003EBC0F53